MYNTKLSNIMTTDLVTVSPNDMMKRVDEIFKSNNFHHLPVVDKNNKIMGIISKSDYLLLTNHMTRFKPDGTKEQNKRFFQSLLVHEVMTKPVARLRANDTVSVAAGFFRENLFHAIPIVDQSDILVGLVTTFDLINFAFQDQFLLSE